MVAGQTSHTPVELLAPAGEPRALRAALAAGADAVYFGFERWSARAFAGNFVGKGAVSAVELAHLHGARAYVALNTLLKDGEIGPALEALEAPYLAGLDGLIVADLGLLMRVRAEYPDLPVHASTQLGTHSSAQLAALARFGCARAVLARELSLAEIAALEPHGLELEAFVHGALCYGYSGGCLLSSMIGGRSGNRGRCSQSCRLRYDLRLAEGGSTPAALGVPLGEDVPVGPASRVMSTSDLAAISMLPQLLAAGVTSFKIEGRMKDAAYVGLTTAVYREALDAALADPGRYEVRAEWLPRLEQSFSRGFSTAHLAGLHDEVRSGGRGGHRGVLVGRVRRVDEGRGEVEVRLSKPVAAGDVVCLYTTWGQTEPARLGAGGDTSVVLRTRERVAVKDRLFRLAAADAGEFAQDLIAGRAALRPVMVSMRLDGAEGRPARLTVVDERTGAQVELSGVVPLAAARTAALTETKARAALGALGGTPYRLGGLGFAVADGLFLPVGELKDLRRRAMAELDELRLTVHRRRRLRLPAAPTESGSTAVPSRDRSMASRPGLVLVLRPGERPLAAPGVDALCLDLLSDDALVVVASAVEQLQATGLPLHVRLPEVLFDADEAWWRAILGLPWQGVYARHLGVLLALRSTLPETGRPVPFALEYPLQGFNRGAAQAAAHLAGRPPAAVVASPEATLEEIAGLATRATGLEVLTVGRQQLLHTRDRLGRAEGLYETPVPGRHVGLSLTDAKGYLFPATVDVGGTRVYNARITNLAANLDELRDADVTGFLVVQSDLSAAERSAFEAGGLSALAPFASRERSTTGHLFRGVS